MKHTDEMYVCDECENDEVEQSDDAFMIMMIMMMICIDTTM